MLDAVVVFSDWRNVAIETIKPLYWGAILLATLVVLVGAATRPLLFHPLAIAGFVLFMLALAGANFCLTLVIGSAA